LSTDELLRSVVDEVAEIRVREHSVLRMIAELERRGAASELGHKDLRHVLRQLVRWDLTAAKQWVDNATLIDGEITPTGANIEPKLPATAEAVAEGALSVEHVTVVAEAMKVLPADREAEIVDYARQFDPMAVRKLGARIAATLDQDGPEPREPDPVPLVNLHTKRWRKDGMLEIRALLGTVTGAKYEAMLDVLAKPRPETAEGGVDTRSRGEREGDALAELVDLMVRADQLPEHGGEPVTLTLTMSYESLAEQVGQALLDNGERVPAAQVRQLACNAGIIPLVLGGQSQPMDIGRKTRTFPAGIRRILVTRDRGCAFPGCDRPPRHCDAHHIHHWADGGDTSVDNAVLLCRHHHTLIHQSEWEVKIVHGIPTFYPPPWLDSQRTPRRNPLHAA
ncbi:MAG TPA: DUF222 domain-containing protein, partial [Lentzea sp.]